jgi:redox-sensitive bicupin YhaK (pirin superfamily)
MIILRPAAERGETRIDWLDSKHSFSFAEYHDPANMGFRSLRVINDDRIAAGAGFPTHGHRDMEILTYVLGGALEHRDSLGTGSVIRPGDVQIMSAGTGIRHSEFNPSESAPLRLLQIWMIPERAGLKPRYDQKAFSAAERQGRLRLVGSRDGREGGVTIYQDIDLYTASLGRGQTVTHEIRLDRHVWIQMARGSASVNGKPVGEGDGVAITGETKVEIAGVDGAELLLFDLA